ncbi:MAG: hypothetical protein C4527_07465 [Candidatus Omnitrophota bacterium]|nr:MAG: hypothetical protein C4527_07465 [Candidatus Omnitrophota bacterium]
MNQPTGLVQFYMLDDITVSNRPRLTVEYSSTQFAIHPGPPNIYSGTVEILSASVEGFLDRCNDDQFKLARFLYETIAYVYKQDRHTNPA